MMVRGLMHRLWLRWSAARRGKFEVTELNVGTISCVSSVGRNPGIGALEWTKINILVEYCRFILTTSLHKNM